MNGTFLSFDVRGSCFAGATSQVDVLFCRNVFIYFDAEVAARIAARLAACLAPGGYAFFGPSDPLPARIAGLEPVGGPVPTVYRRCEGARASSRTPVATRPAPAPRPAAPEVLDVAEIRRRAERVEGVADGSVVLLEIEAFALRGRDDRGLAALTRENQEGITEGGWTMASARKVERKGAANCWDVKKCGREAGGANVATLGACPAYPNQGRDCWTTAGTLCGGVLQGSWAEKLGNCQKCDFYQKVMCGDL